MMANSNLMKNTLLYTVTHGGTAILSFIMLPVYTYYFSPAEFGMWDLVMTTIALLIPLITFELVSASYRWLLDEHSKYTKETIVITGALSISRNLIIINFFIIMANFLLPITIPHIWKTLLLLNLSIVSSFIQQCARGLQLNVLFATSGIVQSVIIVIMNIIFMFLLHLRIEALFYSAMIAHICTIGFVAIRMNIWHYLLRGRFSKPLLKQFLTYSLPIIPGAMSWWVMTMSDRYMIIYFLDISSNGVYAIANKIPAVLLLLNNIFFLAWKDSAITQFHSEQKNAYYSTVFQHFFRLMTCAVILLTLLMKPIMTFVIAETFHNAWKYVGLLLIGSLFHTFSLFWSAGYHGAKKTNIIFMTSVIGAVINVLINLFFLPLIGLYAVGLSTTVAFFVTWMIRLIFAKPHFNITIHYKETILLFALIIIANIVPFFMSYISLIIISCLACIFVIILNFPLLANIVKAIK